MKAQTKIRLSLAGILVLTLLAGLVDIPKGPDIKLGSVSRELKVHLGLDLQGGTSLLYDADVSQIPDEDRVTALEGVRDVIERRINAFGVAEPSIQTVRSGDDWRVLVELPGVTDITEAVNRIGETPLLEFKTEGEPQAYTDEEVDEIRQANKGVKKQANAVLKKLTGESADFEEMAKKHSDDPGSAIEGGDLGEVAEGTTVPEFNDVVFNKAEIGVVYPKLVETAFGYHIIRVDELREGEEGRSAAVHHILFATEPEEPMALMPTYEATGLTGEQLENADVTFDPNTGLPTVSLAFNNEGKELFAQITKENVGKTVAIYLDGEAISTPVVQQEITSGEAIISGDFTLEESKLLAQRLNAGALPVPITLLSQQNVGPTLGQASIERSLFAGILGLVLLSIFMVVYYRLPGLISVIALGIYALLVLAIFKLWPVTLTLAGIAGFILSIGMAVDANVLIFERFKEELRKGKSLTQSIDDGFARAWTSIRDSNVSSLITCLILYWFGSSLIRGFAVTLAIGIALSMFTAITVTRNLLGVFRVKNLWWFGVRNRNES